MKIHNLNPKQSQKTRKTRAKSHCTSAAVALALRFRLAASRASSGWFMNVMKRRGKKDILQLNLNGKRVGENKGHATGFPRLSLYAKIRGAAL